MNAFRVVYAGGALAILLLTIALFFRLPALSERTGEKRVEGPPRQLRASFAISSATVGASFKSSVSPDIPAVRPPVRRTRPKLRTRGGVNFLAVYPAGVSPATPSEPVEMPGDPAQPAAIPSSGRTIGNALASLASNPLRNPAPPRFVHTRPRPLVPLYATFAVLQVADALTTVKALKTPGLREVNPIMRPLAGNVSALLVVKSASTAVTVIAVEKLWRRNRVAAVATMVGINAAYGVIVSKNAAAAKNVGPPPRLP